MIQPYKLYFFRLPAKIISGINEVYVFFNIAIIAIFYIKKRHQLRFAAITLFIVFACFFLCQRHVM